MKTRQTLAAILLGLVALSTHALAANTLIYDDFSRTGTLSLSTPVTTVAGAKWQALNNATASTWSTSGTVLTAGLDQQQTAAIDLGAGYFSTHAGTYTLSAEITMTSGSTGKWLSLGFIQTGAISSGLGGAMNGSDAGWPWILLRDNGGVSVFGGPTTSNSLASLGAGSFTVGSPLTLSLVLNTSLTNWTLDAYVGATQLDLNGATVGSTYTFSSNPDIQYVGLSDSGGGSGLQSVDNFTLVTSVPEPSIGALFVPALLTLVFLSKKRRSQLSY